MTNTHIIIVLVVGACAFILFGILILIVMVRLRRVVTSQLHTIDNLLSTLQANRGGDTPPEHRREQ